MLVCVTDRHAEEWEQLARREPYFAVLTDAGLPGVESGSIATSAFFDTGEADIAALLASIAALLSREVPMTSVLDFGCGAGRVTLPLARRAACVIGCDVAPTILDHARRNAENAGLSNLTFLLAGEALQLPPGTFDFVCSLLVFQHIPPSEGYEILGRLIGLLAPGGVAALHMMFGPPGGGLRLLARSMRSQSRFAPRIRPNQRRPVNEYSESRVVRDVAIAGARLVASLRTHEGDRAGAVLILEKQSSDTRAGR